MTKPYYPPTDTCPAHGTRLIAGLDCPSCIHERQLIEQPEARRRHIREHQLIVGEYTVPVIKIARARVGVT